MPQAQAGVINETGEKSSNRKWWGPWKTGEWLLDGERSAAATQKQLAAARRKCRLTIVQSYDFQKEIEILKINLHFM